MNLIQIVNICATIQSTIEYLRSVHLLRTSLCCCGYNCTIVKNKIADGQIFQCRKCGKQRSIRTGSFFTKSKASLRWLLLTMYFFITGSSAVECTRHLKGGICRETILQWYMYFREIYSLYLVNSNKIILGLSGPTIIQMDECFMGSKRKYNKGTVRSEHKLQFCLV